MPLGHLYVFGEMSISVFCVFFHWVVCFFDIELHELLVASFARIFSHSVGCLFVLFMVSFAVQKLLSLITSHVFIVAFIPITLGDGLEKILLQFMLKSALPMFSSQSFISSLTFRSLIHFGFIFVCGVKVFLICSCS